MKFTRIYQNGKVTWKKEPKKPLTSTQIREIKAMEIEEVKKLPTEEKYVWLHSEFYEYREEAKEYLEQPQIQILIDRSEFLRDSFRQIKSITNIDLRQTLRVHFLDEVSQDEGGLIREWLSILVNELFGSSLGLFVKVNTAEMGYNINMYSNNLDYFYFCGQILAKALFEKIPIKAYLAKFLLKELTGKKLNLDDLKYYDMELWNSVEYMKSNKLEEDIGTFVITQKNPITKEQEQIELKRGGARIVVNEKTKEEFMGLLCEYYLKKSIEKQFTALKAGFYSLIPNHIIAVLDFEELEFLLCGEQEISLSDWKAHTQYKGSYSSNHQVIEWFWKILSKFNNTELEKLLQFCTGTTRPPVEGFAGLSSNGSIYPFTINLKDYIDPQLSFPVAHTCFNRLDLPKYPNQEEMEKGIRTIIGNELCYQFSLY